MREESVAKLKRKNPNHIFLRTIEQFKSLRIEQGVSHSRLAEKTGVSRPAISHIESGKRKPSLLLSLKLAKALQTKLSDIVRKAENSVDIE
jgi:DNA-binding XRE family transcriptional regulator